MPDLSSNLTALRADGHKVRAYLAAFSGVVVASGTLNSAPATGATALAWTRTAGSSSDIKAGYRVVVENGSGALKFETSVRYSGTISDSNLPIREVATAEFTLSASDVVKVYNTPVLTDKLVEANATFAPDGITYSAQNTTISPITNSGGHWAGFVDSGQTYATVVTSGGGSNAGASFVATAITAPLVGIDSTIFNNSPVRRYTYRRTSCAACADIAESDCETIITSFFDAAIAGIVKRTISTQIKPAVNAFRNPVLIVFYSLCPKS